MTLCHLDRSIIDSFDYISKDISTKLDSDVVLYTGAIVNQSPLMLRNVLEGNKKEKVVKKLCHLL